MPAYVTTVLEGLTESLPSTAAVQYAPGCADGVWCTTQSAFPAATQLVRQPTTTGNHAPALNSSSP